MKTNPPQLVIFLRWLAVATLFSNAAPIQAADTLIATGSVWRYLGDGSDQGQAWIAPGFNDSSWPTGVAKLGFGNDNEATSIGNATNQFITFYFRGLFNVPNAGSVTALVARLVRDDGAVVYLNGMEAYRNNLPTTTIDFQTLASGTLARPEEIDFVTTAIAPALLVQGNNLVAVEIHQAATNSSDLGFEFELVANPGAPAQPAITLTNPIPGTALLAGDNVTLAATASDPAGVTRVDFYDDDRLFFSDPTSAYSVVLADVTAGMHVLRAVLVGAGGINTTSATVMLNVTNRSGVTVLLPNGSTWKYLDNGSDQGVVWRAPSFNDSSWANGPAELGYGDSTENPPRPERTVINGGPANNRFITTYFRHTMNLASTNGLDQLIVRLLRDDGAIVYINGTEVFRNNLPAGAVSFTTPASANVGGAAEATFVATNINNPTSFLVPGANEVAVEVHQDLITSSDVSFDLILEAVAFNAAPMVFISSPNGGASFTAGEPVAIEATATDPSGGVGRVDFYVNGQLRGTDATAPYQFTLGTGLTAGSYTLLAVAVDTFGLSATSAPIAITVTLDPNRITLIQNGAVWRYWDRGGDLGTNWHEPGFEDGHWLWGAAELGYGDGDEETVLGFGADANNKFVTSYFRQRFVMNPNLYSNVVLRLRRDDGAVVYVNGTEVFRDNLPAGPITASTLATNATDDGNTWINVNVPPSAFQEENYLAVELHQTTLNSSDITFDLQLLGELAPAILPALQIELISPNVVVSWPAGFPGAQLQFTTSLNPVPAWNLFPGTTVERDGRVRATNGTVESQTFFRLIGPEMPVCQPPLVIEQSTNRAAPIGGNASFAVTAAGTGPISYQWFQNGLEVPGGTAPTLSLTSLQREDGGRYECCLSNACGFAFSCPITLIVGGVNVALADHFTNATDFVIASGAINATNILASSEPNEPPHNGAPASRSLWLGFVAPFQGVFTFHTAGSAFDTILAAYRGTSLQTLSTLGYDDDKGPKYTGVLQLSLLQGERIFLAIDGFAGSSGVVQLTWDGVASVNPVPIILVQPQGGVVPMGSNFTLSVVATNPGSLDPLSYQWRRNGMPLTGAMATSYTIIAAGPADVGFYDVLVANGFSTNGSQSSNCKLGVDTGQLITVTSGSKRRKCDIYYYVATYTNKVNNGYFPNIVEPFKLYAWINVSKPPSPLVNYSCWANRQQGPYPVCTKTRMNIDPPNGSFISPFSYYFELLLTSFGTVFVDLVP